MFRLGLLTLSGIETFFAGGIVNDRLHHGRTKLCTGMDSKL